MTARARNSCWKSAGESVIRNFDTYVTTGIIKPVKPFGTSEWENEKK